MDALKYRAPRKYLTSFIRLFKETAAIGFLFLISFSIASVEFAKRNGALSVTQTYEEITVNTMPPFTAMNARRGKSAPNVGNGSATVQRMIVPSRTSGFILFNNTANAAIVKQYYVANAVMLESSSGARAAIRIIVRIAE
jgi:Ni,Fe-hydrogenase I cytochrome b subunit